MQAGAGRITKYLVKIKTKTKVFCYLILFCLKSKQVYDQMDIKNLLAQD